MTRDGLWPAAMVLVLIAALAVLVSSPAEAKKKDKPPPPARWAVTLPDCTPAGFTLCGLDQTYYEDGADEDGLGIRVSSGQEQGSVYTRFGFAVYRCLPDESCYAENPPLPVHLQDIHLGPFSSNAPEVECEFPGTDESGALCRDLEPPLCMQCFLNGPHPHWADVTGEDYRLFSFELKVWNYDYEGGLATFSGVGYLSIEVFNTDEILMLPDPWDDHNIFGDNWDEPTHVTITKSQEGRWTVDVEVTHPMLFREWYRGCARDPNPKGKCPTEYKFPLDAASNNGDVTFQITWTKITQ